jgi:hypothetical protein
VSTCAAMTTGWSVRTHFPSGETAHWNWSKMPSLSSSVGKCCEASDRVREALEVSRKQTKQADLGQVRVHIQHRDRLGRLGRVPNTQCHVVASLDIDTRSEPLAQ